MVCDLVLYNQHTFIVEKLGEKYAATENCRNKINFHSTSLLLVLHNDFIAILWRSMLWQQLIILFSEELSGKCFASGVAWVLYKMLFSRLGLIHPRKKNVCAWITKLEITNAWFCWPVGSLKASNLTQNILILIDWRPIGWLWKITFVKIWYLFSRTKGNSSHRISHIAKYLRRIQTLCSSDDSIIRCSLSHIMNGRPFLCTAES